MLSLKLLIVMYYPSRSSPEIVVQDVKWVFSLDGKYLPSLQREYETLTESCQSLKFESSRKVKCFRICSPVSTRSSSGTDLTSCVDQLGLSLASTAEKKALLGENEYIHYVIISRSKIPIFPLSVHGSSLIDLH